MIRKKIRCAYCGGPLVRKDEGDSLRDYCPACNVFFYENPLPVVSNILLEDRKILLVKRKLDPKKGYWCLPMGFAETGESIESAALRELREETELEGKITGLVDVESGYSETYGDLLFLTFEAEKTGGEAIAGDDASEIGFFSLDKLPEMAFVSNIHALEKFIRSKQEFWTIIDSFKRSLNGESNGKPAGDFLSDKLIRLIEDNAELIAQYWLNDVRTSHSTPTYRQFDPIALSSRNMIVISHFGEWLGGIYSGKEIREFYEKLGADRNMEGFKLSEVLSALSLTRKNIWEFALSQNVWNKTIDIYMALELERRMMLFFDRAAYWIARGYEL
ncbi:MAG: NUDIX domain-containing protein [Bacteroidetes bacterium]|nr:NUDIX domain-containing protein [Bacteroidota bacterium]